MKMMIFLSGMNGKIVNKMNFGIFFFLVKNFLGLYYPIFLYFGKGRGNKES